MGDVPKFDNENNSWLLTLPESHTDGHQEIEYKADFKANIWDCTTELDLTNFIPLMNIKMWIT